MKESEIKQNAIAIQNLNVRAESFMDVGKETTEFEAFAWARRL